VLVVPYGGGDLESYAMPVLDLSSNGCAVEAAHALPPGERIEGVELWGDRRLLRRATATVLESIPWRTPDGDRRFRLRLKLAACPDASPRSGEQLTSPDRIRGLLGVAALLDTEVVLALPGTAEMNGRLVRAENGELGVAIEATTLVAPRVTVTFELFSVSYRMEARVIRWATSERAVSLAMPLMIHRRRRRYQFRASVPAAMGLELMAYNPATGHRLVGSVQDLSYGGLSFTTDPDEDVLWPGLTLEDARLTAPDVDIPLGELEIRAVQDRGVSRAKLCASTAVDSPAFVDLMARLRYPEMEVGAGEDFDGMINLYEEVGLFGPHMTRNLPPVRDEARDVWERLHKTDLCRTLVQREPNRPVAAVSAVRAWDQSWVIQHMVAAPTHLPRQPGMLHMAYLDYLLPRPDGRYMVVFVNTENRRITTFLEQFFQLTGTPEAIGRRDVGLWVLRGDKCSTPLSAPSAPSGLTVRPLQKNDQLVVQRAAERTFGRLGAAALSLRAGEIGIEETERAFARVGIGRSRRNHIITRRGYPLVGLVEECADPGFNMTWLTNATWVLPIHDEGHGEHALREAARHIATNATPVGAGERFMMIPTGVDTRAFEELGFEHEADVTVHSYNRAGLHRWYYFVRERYGELTAMKQAERLARGA
jgi:hypothetical protein